MKGLLVVICMLSLVASVSYAADPHVTGGVPGPPWQGELREDYCQYGFQDDMISSGWTLGLGQQLGIQCPGAGCITEVGFYVEFTVIDGELDIVIYDDGTEVSRTTLPPGAVVAGDNQFDIEDVEIAGDACIMLCAVNDQSGYWSVLGEDYTNGPFGNTYFSNECMCSTPFTDNNLTMWAVLCGEPTPVEDSSWGRIRTMYR